MKGWIARSKPATEEQVDRSVRHGHEAAEPSDPPPSDGGYPPPVKEGAGSAGLPRAQAYEEQQHPKSEAPQALVEKHSKAWLAIVGMIGAAFTIVNFGISWGRKSSDYATVGALQDLGKQVNSIAVAVAKIDQKIDDSKATDVKPIAEQASKNALDAQAKSDANTTEIGKIKKGIVGFNHVAERSGRPTPIPLQDP